MRTVSRLTIAAALLAVTGGTASAQLGGLGKRIGDAINKKVDEKVSKKIDEFAQKLVDQAFDSMFVGGTPGSKGGGGSFSLIPNATTEAHYNFDVVITYEIESTNKQGKADDKANLIMNFAKGQPYMGTRIVPQNNRGDKSEAFIIFDAKHQAMVMLMQSDKDKFSMAYGWKDAARYASAGGAHADTARAPEADVKVGDVKYTRIGTRKIAGYDAEGYRAESKDGTVDIWVSRDPAIAYGGFMGATSSMRQLKSIPADQPVGMMLEALSTDKDGSKGHIVVTNINTRANVRIDMADYPPVGKAQDKK